MPTQLTPCALVYGVEVILPLEIEIPLLHIFIQRGFHWVENNQLQVAELQALDEKKDSRHSKGWKATRLT